MHSLGERARVTPVMDVDYDFNRRSTLPTSHVSASVVHHEEAAGVTGVLAAPAVISSTSMPDTVSTRAGAPSPPHLSWVPPPCPMAIFYGEDESVAVGEKRRVPLPPLPVFHSSDAIASGAASAYFAASGSSRASGATTGTHGAGILPTIGSTSHSSRVLPVWTCTKCFAPFSQRANWLVHMPRCDGNASLACHTCGRKFPKRNAYTIHSRVCKARKEARQLSGADASAGRTGADDSESGSDDNETVVATIGEAGTAAASAELDNAASTATGCADDCSDPLVVSGVDGDDNDAAAAAATTSAAEDFAASAAEAMAESGGSADEAGTDEAGAGAGVGDDTETLARTSVAAAASADASLGAAGLGRRQAQMSMRAREAAADAADGEETPQVCARGCGRLFKMSVWRLRHEARCPGRSSGPPSLSPALAAARAEASAAMPRAVPLSSSAAAVALVAGGGSGGNALVTERTPCKYSCGKVYVRLDFRLAHEEICDGSPPVTSHAKGAGQGIRESLEAARSALFFAQPRACSAGCGRTYRMAVYLCVAPLSSILHPPRHHAHHARLT